MVSYAHVPGVVETIGSGSASCGMGVSVLAALILLLAVAFIVGVLVIAVVAVVDVPKRGAIRRVLVLEEEEEVQAWHGEFTRNAITKRTPRRETVCIAYLR
jgi:hypothetical protein